MKRLLYTVMPLLVLLGAPSLQAAPDAVSPDVVSADAGPESKPEPEPIPEPPAEPPREFTGEAQLEMDREAPQVGDQVDYRVTVTLPAGWTLDTPDSLHVSVALKPLRDNVRILREETADGTRATLIIPNILVRVGRVKVLPQTFSASGPNGEPGLVRTGRAILYTGSLFANENEPTPGEAFAPLPVLQTDWVLIWTLIIIAIVLVVTLLTILLYHRLRPRRVKPGPPPEPADVVALRALASLEAEGLHKEGAFAPFYTELSTILRTYLGGRWGFDSMDLTTTELTERMRTVQVQQAHFQQMVLLLEDLDLVKFAKVLPSHSQAEEDLDRTRTLITETRPAPKPELTPTPTPETPNTPEGGEEETA